jgi:hypothetical protein
MLAAPLFDKKWQGALLGILAITTAASLGFVGEAAVRISETIPTVGQSSLVPAAFIQIIAKSVATRVLPIGLWIWQQWAFIKLAVSGNDSVV